MQASTETTGGAPRARSTISPENYTRKTAKPMPRTRVNFIPAQSWLGYNWTDRDPELEFVLHCIEESGWSLERIESETEKVGHKVSRYTLYAWFYKGTKRPMNSTMNTVMAVIGWTRKWEQTG